ncbi:MAG: hypothetical protein KatS3mg087_0445 [Patescibacteria group bacterium]|nr:MAG: hypothetical protein KatS3mg087_0445 [Patescibacteria group bacterium]
MVQVARRKFGVDLVEISSAGQSPFQNLSAFRLKLKVKDNKTLPLEVVYQKAKIWSLDEQTPDLLSIRDEGPQGAAAAKRDANERRRKYNNSPLQRFTLNIGGEVHHFDITHQDAFYNWLYFIGLSQNPELLKAVLDLSGGNHAFSDIFFTHASRQGNRFASQARSVAMALGLLNSGKRAEFERIFRPDKDLYTHIKENTFEQFKDLVYGSGT